MNKLLVNLKKECPDTSVSTIPAQLRGHFRVVVHVAFADLAGYSFCTQARLMVPQSGEERPRIRTVSKGKIQNKGVTCFLDHQEKRGPFMVFRVIINIASKFETIFLHSFVTVLKRSQRLARRTRDTARAFES